MVEITRQPTPRTQVSNDNAIRPEDYLPEMANAKLAQEIVRKLGNPSIVSKRFVVFQGMWRAVNHIQPTYNDAGEMIDPGHPTGYSSALRLAVYDHVEHKSVNVDGKYFNNLWAYLYRPNYIINQTAMPSQNAFDNQEPGFFRRVLNRITGAGNKEDPNVQR